MNKKGMELAVGTLIVIILSVFVLIALLIIWNQQTGIFSDFLKNIAGKTNIDSLVTSCNSFVTQQAFYDYCCVKRDVNYEGIVEGKRKIIEQELTCKELSGKTFTGGRIEKLNCENIGCQ